MLVYFLKGQLPWQGLPGKNKNDMIKQLKEEITINELTKGLPEAFTKYLKYCRRIAFDDEPDYKYCRRLFEDLLTKRGMVNDDYFDWFLKKLGKPIPETDFADYVDMKEEAPKKMIESKRNLKRTTSKFDKYE